MFRVETEITDTTEAALLTFHKEWHCKTIIYNIFNKYLHGGFCEEQKWLFTYTMRSTREVRG